MIEFFVVSIICILITLFQKKFKGALALSFIILTVFLGIRYNFGNDYPVYLLHFDLANQGNLTNAFDYERFEKGWIVLYRLCKPIGFFGMVFFLTIFENAILYYLIKKYVPQNWYWLALFGYLFSTSLCLTGLSMMRQFFAMCICLIAFDLVMSRKVVIPLLLVLFAGQFHTTAYVCLPVCFMGVLKDVHMSIKASVFLLTILAVFYFIAIGSFGEFLIRFVSNSVFDVYERRIGEDYKNIIGISTFFSYYLLGVILFMQGKQERSNGLLVFVFFLSYVIDVFKPIAPLISRVGLYFYILYPICMTNAVIKLPCNMRRITIFLLLLFGVYGYFSFILSPGWGNSFLEYKTIFSVDYWM